jgi:periplasmic protein CpxP/Spy
MTMHPIFPSALLALSLGMGLTTVNPILAQSVAPPPAPSTPVASTLPKWMQALQLTPPQVQKVKAIEAQHKASISQQQQKLNQAAEALEALMVSGAPESQIRSQYTQVKTLRSQFEDARFEVTLKLKDVLTPQQRQKLAQLNKQRMANLKNQIQGK